jgi:SAM-dependent methyltransferase
MSKDLQNIYNIRFSNHEEYRNQVWKILVNEYFKQYINSSDCILDLGCGYGEFINNVSCSELHAMDLNPDSRKHLHEDVHFHQQDCSEPWNIEPEKFDLIFSSNFFEHLPSKESLESTISNAKRALKPKGKIIALGPNIAVLKGKYWDFWDHHVALSDQSISELFEILGFNVEKIIPKFLPYNMVRVRKKPLFMVSLYLKVPLFWQLFGKQFLLVATKD